MCHAKLQYDAMSTVITDVKLIILKIIEIWVRLLVVAFYSESKEAGVFLFSSKKRMHHVYRKTELVVVAKAVSRHSDAILSGINGS